MQNRLEAGSDGRVRAVATDEREVIPCTLVFRSVGYHGVALPGAPFDEAPRHDAERRRPRPGRGRCADPGVYCAGWIKRGPTGVIGTNKKDATETVDLLLEDARAGVLAAREGDGSVEALLAERGVEVVTYAGWEAIDALERARGEEQGRPRVKLCTWDELLEAARG